MCVGIPMRIVEIHGHTGIVEQSGIQSKVIIDTIKDPQIGDYVIIHAGIAIQKIDEEEAQATLEIIQEVLGEV